MNILANPGFYQDTEWRRTIEFVDENGEAIPLSGIPMLAKMWEREEDTDPVFIWRSDSAASDEGEIDLENADIGEVTFVASTSQHNHVPRFTGYVWKLYDCSDQDNLKYLANGEAYIGAYGSRITKFKILSSYDGSFASGTVVAIPATTPGEFPPERFTSGEGQVQAALDAAYAALLDNRPGGVVPLRSGKDYHTTNLNMWHGTTIHGAPSRISPANLYTDTGEGKIFGASRLVAITGLTGDFITLDWGLSDTTKRPYNTRIDDVLLDCSNQISGNGIGLIPGDPLTGIFSNGSFANNFEANNTYIWHAAENGVYQRGKSGAAGIATVSGSTWTRTGHRLVEGNPVRLTSTGTLPGNFALATTYYVIAAGLTSSTFRLAATVGGPAITAIGTGTGNHTVNGNRACGATLWYRCYSTFNSRFGFRADETFDASIYECFMFENGGGIWLKRTSTARVTHCDIFTSRFDQDMFDELGYSGVGIVADGQFIRIDRNYIQNNDTHGLVWSGTEINTTNLISSAHGNNLSGNAGRNALTDGGDWDDIHFGSVGGVGVGGIAMSLHQTATFVHSEHTTARVRASVHFEAIPATAVNFSDFQFSGVSLEDSTEFANSIARKYANWSNCYDPGGRIIENDTIELNPITGGGSTQPNVTLGTRFRTNNTDPTSIVGFTNYRTGMKWRVIFGESITTVVFQDSSELIGNGGLNITPVEDDFMDCTARSDSEVECVVHQTTNLPEAVGFINMWRNGDFRSARRGTTFSGIATGDKTLDGIRFSFSSSTDVAPVINVSRQTVTPGDEFPSGSPYFMRVSQTNAAFVGLTGYFLSFSQLMEDAHLFAEQPLWLEFWSRFNVLDTTDLPYAISTQLTQSFGTGIGVSTAVSTIMTSWFIGTNWEYNKVRVIVPSTAGKVFGNNPFLQISFLLPAYDAWDFDIADIQLHTGYKELPFAIRPFAIEEVLVGYYYQAFTVQTINGTLYVPFSPPMRTAPTVSTGGVGTAANVTRFGFNLTHTSSASASITATAEY